MLAFQLTTLCLQIAEHDDEAAFGELFKYFYPKLLLFTKAILKNHELAEEAVEDVFLKLWQNRKMLPAINNLNYYLLVAAKHTAIDYLEKMRKQTFFSLDDVEIAFGEIPVDPENKLISAEAIHIIQEIIDSLPPKCKLIFRLVKDDGLKYKEVAELLNISVKTVETQMSLAFAKIGTALQTRLPSGYRSFFSPRTKNG
jgi:RNA polymerase sigma-70 factor (family 1)